MLWLAALAAWLLYGARVLAVDGGSTPGRAAFEVLAGLAGVAVLATCAWGFLVGRRRMTRWLWQAAAAGTAVQLACYGVAMLDGRVVGRLNEARIDALIVEAQR